MSDTTVTVVDPPEGDPPASTPDTVAETAVAAIGETARSAATAGADAGRAASASYNASDSAEQARIHAEAAGRSEQAVSAMLGTIGTAIADLPMTIATTLKDLVSGAPDTTPPAEPATIPPPVTKPKGHWMDKKLFGGKN